MLNFIDTCSTVETFNVDCSRDIMKEVDIDVTKVNSCIDNSYTRNDNRLLSEDRKWAT